MAITDASSSQASESLAKEHGLKLIKYPPVFKKPEKKMIVDSSFNQRVNDHQVVRGATEADVAGDTLYRLVKSKWDYIANRFTAILFWYDGQQNGGGYLRQMRDEQATYKANEETWTNRAKSLVTEEGFFVRFGAVNVPQPANETFELSTGESSIQKIKSSKADNKKAEFTFRLDDNLEWLDFFEKGSGITDTVRGENKPEQKIYEYSFIKDINVLKDTTSFITRSFSIGSNVKDQKLCLAVCEDDFNTRVMLQGEQRHSVWYYLFEDIRLLGASSGIEYNAEGGNEDMTFSFIYKRLRKFNLQNLAVS